jgi:TolB-like protein
MNLHYFRGVAAILVVSILAVSCGYRPSGYGTSVLPETVSVVAVIPFENRTQRPEIEQRVTEEVAAELSRRGRSKAGRLRVVTQIGEADAVLEGAVTRYQTRSVEFAANGRATRIEAQVLLQATLREVETDTVLWSQTGLIFKEQFDVPPTGEFFDQETIALDKIARGAAEVLVLSIVEGF